MYIYLWIIIHNNYVTNILKNILLQNNFFLIRYKQEIKNIGMLFCSTRKKQHYFCYKSFKRKYPISVVEITMIYLKI